MTIATNTTTRYDIAGIREDLTDVIYNITPLETPFTTSIERGSAKNTFHEWQTDAIDAADNTNAQLEGDDAPSAVDVVATTRLGNYTQISSKLVIASDTLNDGPVNLAGRSKELAYQVAKNGKALRTDIEKISCGTNQARAAGGTGTARKAASLLSWIKTNSDKGTGSAADPSAADGTGTRTDGTTRTITETLLKSVMKSIFDNASGEPDMLMVGSANKQVISTFDGNSNREIDAKGRKLVAAIDYYTGDYGTVRIIPNRFQRSRDAFVLNTDFWKLCWLRPIYQTPLAKTGDAEKRFMRGEWTLEACNEKASGGIFDLA